MKDLISVIVPIYKVELYLNRCIKSIVDQSYKNLEIILVDDGSPDNCPQICDEWAKKDPRIVVIHQENAGLSAARNSGINIAKGDYMAFVDSDDFIDSNMYEELLKCLKNSPYKMSVCYFSRTYDDFAVPYNKETDIKNYDVNETLDDFFNCKNIGSAVWDKLFERDLFENIRFPVGETNEDFPLFIPLVALSGGITHCGKKLYNYRMRKESITDTTWKTDAGIILKHLNQMQEQINCYGLNQNQKSFNIFCAIYSYYTALQLDKNYHRISDEAKSNHKKYLKIMRKHFASVLLSKNIIIKDKILYFLIITRTLRPIYKMIGKM